MKEYFERFFKTKDDVFGILTTTLIYTIMLPMVFSEHRRLEPRYIDLDILFVHLKQMPMVLYYVIMMVILATTVNFFRDILSTAKKYFDSVIASRGYGQTGYPFNNNYEPNNSTGGDVFSRGASQNLSVGTGFKPVPTDDFPSTYY